MNLIGQLKPMFALFEIILIFQVFSCESIISWKTYTPKSVTVPLVSFYSGKLTVPADYKSPNTSSKLTLHIRKMCNSPSPIWNIIALPGGPGHDGKSILDIISEISKALNDISFCIYTIDHRGVGKSKPKLIDEVESENWMEKIDSIINNPNFPLHTLTITNATMDVFEFAKYLIKSMPDSKLGLIGESYGSMLAHRVLSIAPNMFDVCILDGYSVFEEYSIDADKGFILDCKDNPTCNKKLGPNPENIRNLPSHLFDKELNECTRILHNFLETKYKISTKNDLKYRFQKYFNLSIFKKGSHRLLIAMIHHTWTCPDPEIYKEALEEFEFALRKEISNVSDDSSDAKEEFNELVFDYLNLSEIVRIYMENESFNCSRRKYPIGLLHKCNNWSNNKEQYDKIKQYLYTPDYLKSNPANKNKETFSMNSRLEF